MSGGWPKMYRSMLAQSSGACSTPTVGTMDNMLGARVPPHPRPDVSPDADGSVGPSGAGISVAPNLAALPPSIVPERLRDVRRGARGSNMLRVFRLGSAGFARAPVGSALELVPTSTKHGLVQPSKLMPVDEYQRALAATQGLWEVDEA